MAEIELMMPKMGESVAEATIIKWLKEEGDQIDAEESVLEIATDKVDSEIPSTTEGVLKKKLFNEGDVVQVGQAIAIIETEAAVENTPKPTTASPSKVETSSTKTTSEPTAIVDTQAGATNIERVSSSGKFYSPLVRSIAKAEGISIQELESIEGTGKDGRVTKSDILAYIPNKGKTVAASQNGTSSASSVTTFSTPQTQKATVSSHQAPKVTLMDGDEIIEMDRMRKLIAEHMVMSKHVSPHVTSYVEADVTNLVMWRNKMKKVFAERENEKLTFTPLIFECVIKAIKDFPMVNVSVDGDKIIKRKHINLGMAAALPSGNLIVPVLKDADQKNLIGLTKSVNDLANRARENKLQPDEIQGGTYTVTNVGTFGNVMGTPIINQPQVAILAVGAIRKKPAVIETPYGDTIGIRHMMFLSHAYDHRVVDGALGGSFVKKVAEYLENWDINREI
jgi:2-oxoglutarate dehydrogenase E2 component (dihydrolipoamide succinyltransferase)